MGVKDIKKLLASLLFISVLLIIISGVSAEEFDVGSSAVTESPVSAEVDNSVSSDASYYYDVSSDESDSSGYYEAYVSDEYVGSTEYDVSYEYYYVYDNISYEYIESDLDNSSQSIDSFDSYEACVSFDSYDVDSYDAIHTIDSIVISKSCDVAQNVVYNVGETTLTVDEIDNHIILDDYDCYLKIDDNVISSEYNSLEENNSKSPILCKSTEVNIDCDDLDLVISDILDREASESNDFGIDVTPQVDNDSEPVFDSISISSGYISDEEICYGTISENDLQKLLEAVEAENIIVFANSSEDCNVAFIKDATLDNQIDESKLDGYKVTDALLEYYPLTNDVHISIEKDNEDKHGHVINDNNSHGLDYAYVKHVKVIYKDMPNLIFLTSSGDVLDKQSTEGNWDGLNDVLGRASSETLLPDHKAIWTPLLLLLQQDSQESALDSRADDNENKVNNMTASNVFEYYFDNTNTSGNDTEYIIKYEYYYDYLEDYSPYDEISPVANVSGMGDNNVTGTDVNKNYPDNLSKDKENTSNFSSTGSKGEPIQTPSTFGNHGGPTYTLVYAIIGITSVSLLFNSSYMKKRDDD